MGRIIDDRHYLSQTYPAGHRLWADADVVLAVGTRLKYPLMYWGLDGDIPVTGNYDADGKADIAVFRPSDGNWYVYRSSDLGFEVFNFGLNGNEASSNSFAEKRVSMSDLMYVDRPCLPSTR